MRKTFAATVLAVFSFNANAVVINTLNGVNYEWLEVTETQGMTRDQVEVELLDVNSGLYGYQYASRAQVESLFLSYASWSGVDGNYGDASVVAGIDSFVSDFGVTFMITGDGVNFATETDDGYTVQIDSKLVVGGQYGLKSECSEEQYSCLGANILYVDAAGDATMATQNSSHGWKGNIRTPLYASSSYAYADYGSFLLRTSLIPVPAAVWLFGSALAGLGWMRRKQTI
jgi:hypothetical protein